MLIPDPLASPPTSSAYEASTLRFRALVILITLSFSFVLLTRQVVIPPLVALALRDASTRNGIAPFSYLADMFHHTGNETDINNVTTSVNTYRHSLDDNDEEDEVNNSEIITATTKTNAHSIYDDDEEGEISNNGNSHNDNNDNNDNNIIIPSEKTDTESEEDVDEDEEIAGEGIHDDDNEQQIIAVTTSKKAIDSSSATSIQSSEKDTDSFDNNALSSAPRTTSKSLNGTTWHIPPTMSMLAPLFPNTTESKRAISHVWTQPRILSAYTRRLHDDSTQLFIYATGVTMGNFDQRNLSIFGCLLGPDVYPLKYQRLDVFLCKLPATRKISPDGEPVSLVIRDDEALHRATSAPVHVRNGVFVNLTRDVDVLSLPSGVSLPSSLSPDHFVMVSSSVLARDDAKSEAAAYNRDVVRIGGAQKEEEKISRFEICGVTMMKQFPNLLPDWITYHRRIGVDMIYLLDNDATVDLNAMFANRSDVDVMYWPFHKSQVQSMSLFAVAARHRCEWLIGFDADEYIMLGLGSKNENAHKQVLKLFLNNARRAGFDDVQFKYLTMGPSGNVHIPSIPVPEAYIAKWPRQKSNGKSASLTSRNWLISKIHYQRGQFLSKSKRADEVNDRPVTLDDGSALVHFQFRSLEEAMLKKKFGTVSTGVRGLGPGTSPETRTLENPSEGYTKIPENLRYEYFRDLWRIVMDDETSLTQTLVKWGQNGERCTVSVSQDLQSMSEELCVRELK